MRKLLLALSVVSLFCAPPIAKADPPGGLDTTRVEIPIRALLAPSYGYEEKNNVEVVLWGFLPNQCHTLSQAEVEKQADGVSFRVRQYAINDQNGVCANQNTMPDHMKLEVPYTNTVSIGHLVPGNYKFLYSTVNAQPQSRSLNVQQNVTLSVDTFPYAAVSLAEAPDIVNGADSVKVHITGTLNSTCITLDQNIKVVEENDVFVILPTTKVTGGLFCPQILIPFDQEVDLGKTFPGPHLIHVRSMNGKSVNKVVIVTK